MKQYIKFQNPLFSFLYEIRMLILIVALLSLSFLVLIASLSYGETNFSFLTVMKSLLGQADNTEMLIINRFRLPRTLAALLVGCSLALSGAIIQTVVKNPLASPNLIGITNGGLFGTLVFITIFTDTFANTLTVSKAYMPLFSLVGGFIGAMFVYLLAFKRGVTPYRLILVGIAIQSGFNAVNNLLIIRGPMIIRFEANAWLTGTVYGTDMIEVFVLFIWLLILVGVTVLLIRDLNVQNLDDKIVLSVGAKLERKRLSLLLISTALASSAVSIGGAIGFVGLVAPHITRRISNSSFGNVLPITLIIGGIIVVLADLLGRVMFYPIEVPAGVFTSIIGAPFFMYLLYKNR